MSDAKITVQLCFQVDGNAQKRSKKTRQTGSQTQPKKKQNPNPHCDDKGGGSSKYKPLSGLADDELTEIEVSPDLEVEMNELLTSGLKGVVIISLNLVLTRLTHGTGLMLTACDRADRKHWLGKGDGPLRLLVEDIKHNNLK